MNDLLFKKPRSDSSMLIDYDDDDAFGVREYMMIS